jgi:phosphoserine phosphatase
VPATKLICFDCDSTLSAIEGVDELARLRGPEVLAHIEAMTNAAMDGRVSIESVFGRRLEIIRPRREDAAVVGRRYVETVEPTAKATIAGLAARGWTILILSGGFTPVIRPLADYLGVARIEPEVITRLRHELQPAFTVMVGDGTSDLETQPVVDRFIGFGRYAVRPRVKAEAGTFITSLEELGRIL